MQNTANTKSCNSNQAGLTKTLCNTATTPQNVPGPATMNRCEFDLQVFRPSDATAIIQPTILNTAIHGHIKLDSQHIVVDFTIIGDISLIKHSPITPTPKRKDNLWQSTCFEVFTAATMEPDYWEYNIAPSHNWNVYHFDAYREGQTLDPLVGAIKIKTQYANKNLNTITASLPLSPRLAGKEISLGISCILQDINNNLNYYALVHPAHKPDFHDKRGFVIRLNH